jgi:biotin carboxylase
MADAMLTQRITEKDIVAGQIRVPGPAKALFPKTPDEIEVRLRGHCVTCRWNPRDLPRPRSGTIRIGHNALKRLVEPDERLPIRRDGDQVVIG